MDPIKNAGAVDYAMTVPQNQNQVEGYGDYSSMPMVYEPEVEQKKKASSNMLGMAALGAAALGTAIYAAKNRGKIKDLKLQNEDLTVKNQDLKNKLDAAEKKIEELTPKSFKEKLKEFFKKLNPFKKKNVEKEAENTAEKAKDAAEEATKNNFQKGGSDFRNRPFSYYNLGGLKFCCFCPFLPLIPTRIFSPSRIPSPLTSVKESSLAPVVMLILDIFNPSLTHSP